MANRIEKIWVERIPDPDSTPDHLGSYSDTPASPYSFDRLHAVFCAVNEKGGDAQCTCSTAPSWHISKEYRYFNPAATCGDRAAARANYLRAQAYDSEWSYLTVRAGAEVVLANVAISLQTHGVCGVESDSGEENFFHLEAEEAGALAAVLDAMGFSEAEIEAATPAEWRG